MSYSMEIINFEQTACELARQIAEHALPQNKYEHTLRVVKLAEQIAIRDGANVTMCKVAAYLHDVLEDGDKYFPLDIATIFGFPILEIVESLTHDKENETYEEYIDRIFQGRTETIVVKRADMKDHLLQKATLTPKLRDKYINVLDRFI